VSSDVFKANLESEMTESIDNLVITDFSEETSDCQIVCLINRWVSSTERICIEIHLNFTHRLFLHPVFKAMLISGLSEFTSNEIVIIFFSEQSFENTTTGRFRIGCFVDASV
jgi:hypothetical protein